MADERVERRLAAILAADVVGYSRLMGADEVGTLAALKAHRRELIDPKIAEHHGRIVKTTGDGMLVEFASVVDAVQCAVEVNRAVVGRNAEVPQEKRIEFRVGINVGDVIVDGADIYGDGVNIAARLEGLADPGGICLSQSAADQVRGKLVITIEDMGERELKNIELPMRVFRVRSGGAPKGPASSVVAAKAALALPNKPSLAVLPFQNMSGDPEQEYFADGMVEDITTALSKVQSFFVIARNSSFSYKNKVVDVKQVGRELGVRYVLEGSVRKAGGRIRITGQLIEVATGHHLWADRFDGAIEEVFALQDQVTHSVVGAIEPNLQRAEIERAIRKPTENLDAYDFFLRGMALAHGLSKEQRRESQQFFLKATELDPNYHAAYALAAMYYHYGSIQGWLTDPKVEIAEGVRLAHRAVESGTNDPVALANAGLTLAFLGNEAEAGIRLIDRALAINPSYAFGWYDSGAVRNILGNSDVAIEHVRRAMRLDPRTPLFFLYPTVIAAAHLYAGRYDEAVAAANEALGIQAAYVSAQRLKASALGWLGRTTEARQVISQILAVQPAMRLSNLPERLPYLSPRLLARLIDGLRLACFPE